MTIWAMTLTTLAGLMGAAGVAAGAAAAHLAGSGPLETAGTYLILHAAAALAIARGQPQDKTFLASASLLIAGAVLFAGDIALRALAGLRLFPMAAPLGGLLLIAGWLTLALAGLRHLATASGGANDRER